MTVRIGVVVFPGSNCDRDTLRGLELAGAEAVPLWHEQGSLDGVAAIVLPGGFAYGDYLRAGVIARFSPVMRAVSAFAADGGLVLGICNGFQVLAEAGLVPGALLRNRGLRFLGRDVRISAERLDTPFTALVGNGRPLRMPIAHGEGCWVADDETLSDVEARGQVVFRYTDERGVTTAASNPNGSLANIAGVCNEGRNVVGLMPHPERCSEALLGGTDGYRVLANLAPALAGTAPAIYR
jgi:phosphoribosylformylglycinamidine synthase subunit PurQ / glutaminase